MLTLPPFKAFLASNIPSVYDNTLSYYDELTKLIGYIETVILPAIDKNTAEIKGLYEKFQELKDYVDNYFENLDVQEEINNKLDEMAESGELATIIDQFVNLGVLFTYDTLADMIAAENLIAGCTCRTLGKATINDGFGGIYKIAGEGDIALDNGLYATLKDNTTGDNYYEEIVVTNGRVNDTDYYVATIPYNDSEGNMIPCYVDEVPDHTLSPLQYAEKNFTTITMNAGLGRQDSQDLWKQGAVIANGVILHGDECDLPIPEWYSYLGIKADRSVVDYPGDTTPETMLADGVENAFLTFGTIVKNGVVDIPERWITGQDNPWQTFGVKADGTFVIVSSDGRTQHDPGMTIQECAGLMVSLGCVTAWKCDGGGSTSLVYKGSKQNRNIDEDGTLDRGIWVTLNFKKQGTDKQLAKAYSFIGEERQLLNRQIRDDMRSNYEQRKAFVSYINTTSGYNTAADNQRFNIITERSYSRNNRPADLDRVIEAIKDENNRNIGFKYNRAGLLNISYCVGVTCVNTAGRRRISLDNPIGTSVNNWAVVQEDIAPAAANEIHQMSINFTLNNNVAGSEYYFAATGVAGDKFDRINVSIKEIGNAD